MGKARVVVCWSDQRRSTWLGRTAVASTAPRPQCRDLHRPPKGGSQPRTLGLLGPGGVEPRSSPGRCWGAACAPVSTPTWIGNRPQQSNAPAGLFPRRWRQVTLRAALRSACGDEHRVMSEARAWPKQVTQSRWTVPTNAPRAGLRCLLPWLEPREAGPAGSAPSSGERGCLLGWLGPPALRSARRACRARRPAGRDAPASSSHQKHQALLAFPGVGTPQNAYAPSATNRNGARPVICISQPGTITT